MRVRRKSTHLPGARPSAISIYSTTSDLNDEDDHHYLSRYCLAINEKKKLFLDFFFFNKQIYKVYFFSFNP
jgi:hypothetical protein